MNEIKHFKLSNGEEIVCDVVEWPDPDGDSPDLVVRNSYKIVTTFIKGNDGARFYQFRPWMIYQDDPEMFQVINCNHIIGEANPPTELIEQYCKVVLAEDLTTEDLQKKLAEYIDDVKQNISSESDNSDKKIIKFPNKNKLH
jgi:hypothetical protein